MTAAQCRDSNSKAELCAVFCELPLAIQVEAIVHRKFASVNDSVYRESRRRHVGRMGLWRRFGVLGQDRALGMGDMSTVPQ